MAKAALSRSGRRAPEPASRRDGESLADLAYARFRDRLQDGTLKPGQRLLETALAESLGMSRTPVREAMRRLQSEGLIAAMPPRGLCVAAQDPAQLDELYVMREALEGTAARLAARHAGDAEIALLKQLIAQEAALPNDDAARLAEHNRRFHRALHHAAHNRYLIRSLATLSDALLLLGPTTLDIAGRPDAARAEHAAIIAAVAAHDGAGAENAARAHIRAAQAARLQLNLRLAD